MNSNSNTSQPPAKRTTFQTATPFPPHPLLVAFREVYPVGSSCSLWMLLSDTPYSRGYVELGGWNSRDERARARGDYVYITTCHCQPDWDMRCGCFPPVTQGALDYMSSIKHKQNTGLFWHKAEGHEDNWVNCPNRINKAAMFAHDSLHYVSLERQCGLLRYMLPEADVEAAKAELVAEYTEEESWG
jgi:hypothetical protein